MSDREIMNAKRGLNNNNNNNNMSNKSKFSYPLTDNERELQRSAMTLREELDRVEDELDEAKTDLAQVYELLRKAQIQNEMLDDASDYWKEQFEMLFNEVNEHGVLADVLEKWEGESDELNKINK